MAIHALIDYPLSSAARLVRALAGVEERERETLALRGLADIEESARDPRAAGAPLSRLAVELEKVAGVRPAGAADAEQGLARLRVPAMPSGLSATTAARLEALRRRAAAVSEVFVAERPPARPLWLALTPARERVILVP